MTTGNIKKYFNKKQSPDGYKAIINSNQKVNTQNRATTARGAA